MPDGRPALSIHRIALAATLTLASGCGGFKLPPGMQFRRACDRDLLESAATSAEVQAACEFPAALEETWACPTPMPQSASVDELRTLHKDCGLESLAEQEAFATASGQPLLATGVLYWLNSVGYERPEVPARLLLGDSPLLGDLHLPPMPGIDASEVRPGQMLSAELPPLTGWGSASGSGWEHPDLTGSPVVQMDESRTVRTVRHALASLASPDQPLEIVGAGVGVTTLPLYRPEVLTNGVRVRVAEDGSLTVEGEAFDPTSNPEEVVLDMGDDAALSVLTTAMATLAPARVALALDRPPCRDLPGMACVRRDPAAPSSLLYLDSEPTSGFDDCKEAGGCRSSKGTWASARELCSWQGKRLPTRQEWSEATKAGLVTDSEEAQWLFDWEGEGGGAYGPCDGAPRCAPYCGSETPPSCRGKADKTRSDGTAVSPDRKMPGPVRCATTNTWLTTFPPHDRWGTEFIPPRPEPQPDLAKIAHAIDQDDILEKGVCGEEVRAGWLESLQSGGRSTMECRDPYSYVTSNEPRRYIWSRHFANLGGGYIGVGSDQAYDFITVARSEWAWVYDYDPNVVRLHRLLRILIKASPTRDAFLLRFEKDNAEETLALVEAGAESETQARVLKRFYYGYREKLRRHYKRSLTPLKGSENFGWLTSEDNYGFVYTLQTQDRIIPIAADMLGSKSFRSVGAAAERMGVPIRVYYASNAPTAWGLETDGAFNQNYRENVLSLPFDENSVVLQTFNFGAFGKVGYWHYNVMDGPLFQERMSAPGYQHSSHRRGPIWDRVPGHDPDLTLSGLRGVEAAQPSPAPAD